MTEAFAATYFSSEKNLPLAPRFKVKGIVLDFVGKNCGGNPRGVRTRGR
jgi:hypothetical protein